MQIGKTEILSGQAQRNLQKEVARQPGREVKPRQESSGTSGITEHRANLRRLIKQQEPARKEVRRVLREQSRKKPRINIESITYKKTLTHRKHAATGRQYVRVINAKTHEVIREVPPREQLDRLAKMMRYVKRAYGK